MGQEGFSHTSNFWFDHYWWVLWIVLFGALLRSSFTHRKASCIAKAIECFAMTARGALFTLLLCHGDLAAALSC